MAGLCEGGNEPPGSLKARCLRLRRHGAGPPDIIRNIKSRRLRWAGHVACVGESGSAYRVLLWRLDGKRPLGRPRRRWEDNIKMDLREVGYDDRDWIDLAQDRDQRRAYQEDRDITYALFCSVLCIMEQVLFDEILILSVEENPHVYDKRRASYKDEKTKENTWLSIAASLNTDRKSLPSKETLRGHSDSSFRGEGYIQYCVGVRLCDMYSNQELAEIHFMYGKADGNAALARRLHQETYPQRQCPDRKTFVRLHYRLCEYGKFNSPGLGMGRPRSTTPEVQEEILEATLSSADYPARVRFCQWFLQQCGVNPNFPALVLFKDEAQFTPDGITNFHNQHVWAYENPRATVPSHHQVRFSLNMWAGIIGDRLVGPHVLVNRLTGQAYTNFLENTIPHVLKDTPLINRQHIHFLHDGAPAHFSRTARRYLDRRFPDRWVGGGGPIAWPPRSPDLNPLDFYLWGHLKSLVYSSPVPDLESLRNRIVACSEDIRNTPGVWDRVRRSMRHRCEVCIQAGGEHFEHLLY
ncbi:hypothetical protein ANN_25354 [Periplaneta americana]|uniref:MADF domain-containing protein n=1 Tax=Periplaneta americana TaxID=6978 RepID=A0ABQ8S187_PERAM|nr:hypothetical protein ANN_25354 [Periplaneta americana]